MMQPLVLQPRLRPLLRKVGLLVALTLTFGIATALAWRRHDCGCSRMRNMAITMHTIQESVVHYRADHDDACPPTIAALVDGHYLTHLPHDDWGREFALHCSELDAQVVSAGRDGRFGTADDRRTE